VKVYDVEALFSEETFNLRLQPYGQGDAGRGAAGRHWDRPADADEVLVQDAGWAGKGGNDLDLMPLLDEVLAQVEYVSHHPSGISVIVGGNQANLHSTIPWC
jgi:hypothetical protein